MRLSDIINEIEAIPASDYTGSRNDILSIGGASDSYGQQILGSQKPLPGSKDLMYATVSKGDYLSAYILFNNQIVGELLTQAKSAHMPEPIFQVSTIAVHKKFRGQGIARALYGVILSILKKPLIAGDEQTPGGQRSWVSLNNIPGVEVSGYASFKDDWFEPIKKGPAWLEQSRNERLDAILDGIMNAGGEYWGESPKGRRFFKFPVEPGTGRLQPAVSKALDLYIGDKGTRGFNADIDVGLVAYWTGN